MAYVLRTDKTVNNPNIDFPYLTDRGIASRDLGIYSNELKSHGYTLSESEFSALKNLEEGLKDLELWDSFTEIMPMMGDSIQTQALKFKSVSNSNATPVNGLDDQNVDGKGLIWHQQEGVNARYLDLNISESQALSANGFGHVVYLQSEVESIGIVTSENALDLYRSANNLILNIPTSRTSYGVDFLQPSRLITNVMWDFDRNTTVRSVTVDGNVVSSSDSSVAIEEGGASSLKLGMRLLDGETSLGMFGKIRFLALHSGIEVDKIPLLDDIFESFISESGKTL